MANLAITDVPKPRRSRRDERGNADQQAARAAAVENLDVDEILDHVENLPSTVDVTTQVELDGQITEVTAVVSAARGYTVNDLSLTFDADTPYEVWERDTLRLITVTKRVLWLVADALVYGEDKWGEKASQIIPSDTWSRQTLYNMTYVARQIPPERRRDDLSFSVQAEVASLPPEQQVIVLTKAAEEGWNAVETRQAVSAVKREAKRLAAEGKPVPVNDFGRMTLEQGDATSLPLEYNSVDLIVTSPPYGIQNLSTGEGVKKYRQDDDYEAWRALMVGFLNEAMRVLKDQGRLCINIPLDTSVGGENGGQRMVYAWLAYVATEVVGFTYVTTINWDEGNISNTVARGSVDSCSAPRVINRQETVLVLCKGKYQRPSKLEDGTKLTTDITHEEWLEYTNGTWEIQGVTNGWEGFAAAFPRELSDRLIKLFSFREDTVCDPFLGSGTSAVSSLLLGRTFYGYDIDGKQIESSLRRLDAVRKGVAS